MSEGSVKSAIQNGVGVIEFSHPKANSLPSNLLSEIATSITSFSTDKKCKVILLKSAGEKAFCAGASFDELLALENDESAATEYFLGFAKVILAMRDSKKFVVTRVQGSSVGGAVGLIAASDLAFASKKARVKLSELSLGFGPFVIAAPVQRKIGAGAFSELSILAEWRDAEWAKQKCLFTEIYSDDQELDVALEEKLSELTMNSLDAMEQIKRVAWEGTESWDQLLPERAQKTAKLVLTSSVRTKLQSFKS